jgi:hypothetical protein
LGTCIGKAGQQLTCADEKYERFPPQYTFVAQQGH